jgi:hypothetical protein
MEGHFSYLPSFFLVWDYTLYRFMDLQAPGHGKKNRIRELTNFNFSRFIGFQAKQKG